MRIQVHFSLSSNENIGMQFILSARPRLVYYKAINIL